MCQDKYIQSTHLEINPIENNGTYFQVKAYVVKTEKSGTVY